MKLDPRTKLIIVFTLSSLAVFVQRLELLVLILLIASGMVYIIGGNFSLLKRIRKFIYLFLVIAVLQSLFSPSGESLLSINDFTVLTAGGLIKGSRVVLRMVIIIISASLMIGSSFREIVQGLIQWKVPYELAFMVSLAARFLPLLEEEVRDVYTAIQLRGIEPEKLFLKKRLELYSYLLVPILVGVMAKAREISISMETRAFRAYPERSSYLQLKFTGIDYLFMFLNLLLVLSILFLKARG